MFEDILKNINAIIRWCRENPETVTTIRQEFTSFVEFFRGSSRSGTQQDMMFIESLKKVTLCDQSGVDGIVKLVQEGYQPACEYLTTIMTKMQQSPAIALPPSFESAACPALPSSQFGPSPLPLGTPSCCMDPSQRPPLPFRLYDGVCDRAPQPQIEYPDWRSGSSGSSRPSSRRSTSHHRHHHYHRHHHHPSRYVSDDDDSEYTSSSDDSSPSGSSMTDSSDDSDYKHRKKDKGKGKGKRHSKDRDHHRRKSKKRDMSSDSDSSSDGSSSKSKRGRTSGRHKSKDRSRSSSSDSREKSHSKEPRSS